MNKKNLIVALALAIIFLFVSSSFGQSSQVSYGWTKIMGGTSGDWGQAIITDSSGNVYVTGDFSGTVNFGLDFGTTDIKTSAGSDDIYVTKINANGTYGWTRIMGGTAGDYGNGITTDSSGNVYVTGDFSGTVNFGLDFGTTDIKTSAVYNDIYVTKINANGTYGWTKIIGWINHECGLGIATDSSDNVYVTGYFEGTVNFGLDFGTTDIKTSAAGRLIFITKINANGTYGWTRIMGATFMGARGDAITTDSSGNVYVTGYFVGTVNFGLDFGTTDIKTSAGIIDIYVTKINANGTYGWTRIMGGIQDDHGSAITTDSSGNVYVTGYFWGTVNFGLDFGTTDIKTSAGGMDIFITKINANGTYGWTKIMGGTWHDSGNAITTDSSDNVYVTGAFGGTVNFGLDFGTTDIKTSAGSEDIFITKINANGSYSWTKIMGGTSTDGGSGITTDSSDNVYVTGGFNGAVNFGLDFGTTDIKTSAGGSDIFITKLNSGESTYYVFDGHDFDGNGSSDISIWRPSNGIWFVKDIAYPQWGTAGDIPVNGDYDGNGITDIAVWRPSNGCWFVKDQFSTQWGTNGDIPVPGKYDSDNKTDMAVWRPSDGCWFIKYSGGGVGVIQWGTSGDIPVPGDYDGDGLTDIAVWRPSDGCWFIKYSGGGVGVIQWGTSGDIPVPGKYDSDNKTDIAVWRPSDGFWFVRNSSGGVSVNQWGTSGDIPTPGDYDGNGSTDIAVFRPSNGYWFVKGQMIVQWGISGDVPLVR
jgi:hypothetical protein